MKNMISLLALGLISTSAWAGSLALECPKNLEGKWFCHAEGMPGDGTDETTFNLEIKSNRVGKVITSYDFSGEERILDNQLRIVPELSRGPNSGSTLDWYRRSTCDQGRLNSEYVAFDADGKRDSTSPEAEVIQMQDADHFTIKEALSSDTNICTRVN